MRIYKRVYLPLPFFYDRGAHLHKFVLMSPTSKTALPPDQNFVKELLDKYVTRCKSTRLSSRKRRFERDPLMTLTISTGMVECRRKRGEEEREGVARYEEDLSSARTALGNWISSSSFRALRACESGAVAFSASRQYTAQGARSVSFRYKFKSETPLSHGINDGERI